MIDRLDGMGWDGMEMRLRRLEEGCGAPTTGAANIFVEGSQVATATGN